jgi:hypothetical protein
MFFPGGILGLDGVSVSEHHDLGAGGGRSNQAAPSLTEPSLTEPSLAERMELEQPERAIQARRSEVTSPKALVRNRSRSETANQEHAPAPECPESRRDQ